MDAYLDYARRFQLSRLISLPEDGSIAVVYDTETGVSVRQAYTETVRVIFTKEVGIMRYLTFALAKGRLAN